MTRSPTPTPKQSPLPIGYAFICLLPILIFYSSETLLATLAHNSVNFSSGIKAPESFPAVGEAAARLRMLGMALLVLVGAAAVLIKFGIDVLTNFSKSERLTLALAFGLVLALGAVFVLLIWLKLAPEPRTHLGASLFGKIFLGLRGNKSDDLWDEGTYAILISLTHFAVLLSAAAFIAGGISCLARFPELDEKENWTRQSNRIKTYLFLSAGYLVIGVLYFKSWAEYPTFLLASQEAKSQLEQYLSLANAYTSFTGLEYSLVLAAYALPVSYIQSRKIDAMVLSEIKAKEASGASKSDSHYAEQIRAEKQKAGLETGPLEILKYVAAIIGPFMTGALTTLTGVMI